MFVFYDKTHMEGVLIRGRKDALDIRWSVVRMKKDIIISWICKTSDFLRDSKFWKINGDSGITATAHHACVAVAAEVSIVTLHKPWRIVLKEFLYTSIHKPYIT